MKHIKRFLTIAFTLVLMIPITVHAADDYDLVETQLVNISSGSKTTNFYPIKNIESIVIGLSGAAQQSQATYDGDNRGWGVVGSYSHTVVLYGIDDEGVKTALNTYSANGSYSRTFTNEEKAQYKEFYLTATASSYQPYSPNQEISRTDDHHRIYARGTSYSNAVITMVERFYKSPIIDTNLLTVFPS